VAAALAAKGECEKPPELVMALNCKAWGCLPVAGGILEQPARLFNGMNVALNVYSAYREWLTKSVVDAVWADTHPDEFSLVVKIEKMLHGG
jgi:hypothetical protein